MTTDWKAFWNQRYSEENFVYGVAPNRFFAEQLQELTIGKLLLPAEGEGRNAVFAAKLGWQVTAFDFSSAAKEKALKLAELNNTTIDYDVAELTAFNAPENSFNAIALIYVHMQPNIRQILHKQAAKWLKPGGKLILEAFNKKQLQNSSGGPKDEEMLYDRPTLKGDFYDAFKIDYCGEVTLFLNEGEYHKGKADVVRLIATKK